jgi:hypothetical protein
MLEIKRKSEAEERTHWSLDHPTTVMAWPNFEKNTSFNDDPMTQEIVPL